MQRTRFFFFFVFFHIHRSYCIFSGCSSINNRIRHNQSKLKEKVKRKRRKKNEAKYSEDFCFLIAIVVNMCRRCMLVHVHSPFQTYLRDSITHACARMYYIWMCCVYIFVLYFAIFSLFTRWMLQIVFE